MRVLCIPVRWQGEIIAVLTRESAPSFGRAPGELERTYVEVFNRFARMIASGQFPFATEDARAEEAPRVGDGVILLDAPGGVEYTSPNAVSALHRVGVHANTEGMRLGELGLEETPSATPSRWRSRSPRRSSGAPRSRCSAVHPAARRHGRVGRGRAAARHLRAAPPRPAAAVEGRHDPRDPPPGEEQPADDLVAAAPAGPPARVARGEGGHRGVGAAHRARSRSCTRPCRSEAGDDVPFIEIVRPLVRMVEEALVSPDRPVAFKVEGDAGNLPAAIATPLAVVLNELLQNAVDHAFPDDAERPDGEGTRAVELATTARSSSCGWSTTASGCPRASAWTTTRARAVDRAGPGHVGAARDDRHVRADRRQPRAPSSSCASPPIPPSAA